MAEIFTHHVIDGAYEGASSGDAAKAIRAPGGSKDALWADITPYESGSDHWIYQEGAFAIPTVYLRDWQKMRAGPWRRWGRSSARAVTC